MNILNKLTIKHLIMNKKRTIVTIVGIILSTALMVGIGTLASSFVGYMIEDAKERNGSHHVEIYDIDNNNLKYLKSNTDVLEYAIYGEVGYAILEESENEYKPYVYIKEGDQNYLKTSELLDGRLPQNTNEIVISVHIINNAKVKLEIGDVLKLGIGERVIDDQILNQYNPYQKNEKFVKSYEKEYTVVGIIARRNDEPYTAPGYTIITHNDTPQKGTSTALITYKKVKDIQTKTEKIAKFLEIEKCDIIHDSYCNINYNESLLSYYGESSYDSVNKMLTGVVTIVLTLIMVGCAIVIYNSFAISVMERKKQFGLFSSIGATKKQLRKTVFYEAIIVSVIGIPIGVLSGILGIWVVIQIINNLFPMMDPKITLILIPIYIILPIAYMVLTILFSAFVPAKRASMISPIEAIRLNDDIKVNKRKIRTGKLTEKIFGIESLLALKNIKRNKKKYRITILSLVTSIVLFLSFSAFLEYGMKSSNSFYEVSNYDISINFNNAKNVEEQYKEVLQKLENIDSITDINTLYYKTLASDDIDYNLLIREISFVQHLSNDYYKYYGKHLEQSDENISTIGLGFTILPNDKYKEYIKELGFDPKKYDDKLILICPNLFKYYDYENAKIYEFKWHDEKYKELNFTFRSYIYRDIVTDNDKYVENTVTIPVTYVDKIPKLMERAGNFIISEDMSKLVEELFPKVTYEGNSYPYFAPIIYLKTSDANLAEREIKKALDIKDYENLDYRDFDIYNVKSSEEEERNTILLISILLYGFISLVTLIGVTSVFNTINTSIFLRRKEFAVLRSIGLTPKGFNKMIRYESILYGLKALLIGVPISFFVMWLIIGSFNNIVDFTMFVPIKPLIICILGVFAITFITMMYASSKIKHENILDAIREENI